MARLRGLGTRLVHFQLINNLAVGLTFTCTNTIILPMFSPTQNTWGALLHNTRTHLTASTHVKNLFLHQNKRKNTNFSPCENFPLYGVHVLWFNFTHKIRYANNMLSCYTKCIWYIILLFQKNCIHIPQNITITVYFTPKTTNNICQSNKKKKKKKLGFISIWKHSDSKDHEVEIEPSKLSMRAKFGRSLASLSQHCFIIRYTPSGQPSGASILYPRST